MLLENYLDKIKYGCLVGLAALSFYASPTIAQMQENKKSDLEKIVVLEDSLENLSDDSLSTQQKSEESNKNLFSNFSLLTNFFNTYQFNFVGGIRRKSIDTGFGFSGAKKEGEIDPLLNFWISKKINLKRTISIIPYLVIQSGLSDKEAVYETQKISNPNARKPKFYQNNISIGFQIENRLSNKVGIGFDVRRIHYPDKRAGNGYVIGIFATEYSRW